MSLNSPEVGVGFLLETVGQRRIFTPEDFTEEQRLFLKTAQDFMEKEVLAQNEAIEHLDYGLLRRLLRKAGDLGLLAIDIPEAYGGLGLDKTTSALVSEAIAAQGSFAVTFVAHVGIGTLPIVIFGTEAQKARYLPSLASGERVAAYCLSEPGSGSDALGARTTATRDGDVYVLNGVKQWISNAAIADVFIVFAQVDARLFTAFIVDRETPGVSIGKEEKKLGLKGSSTCQLILEDVRVPADNLLGEIGRGSVIAFNILNVGRYKLGVGASGTSKPALNHALRYAMDRKQFQTPIVEFPAIREKLARMATFIFANDSMAWRLCGTLDHRIESLDAKSPDHWRQAVDILKDFSIECSILKVYGSEGVGRVLDEALQIFGGYGFTQEYPIEQPYRDARVNRIFEGTNEINRMLIPGTLFKRVMQGQLNLMPVMAAVEAEVKGGETAVPPPADETLTVERFMVEQAKKVLVYAAGAAVQKHMAELDRQQEILLVLADMVMDVYAADSVVARVGQFIDAHGAERAATRRAVARIVAAETYRDVAVRARDLASHLANNPGRMVAGVDRLSPFIATDLIAARRLVSDHVIDVGRYPF
ncbi:MAG: acyl-CoA dehydrogenase family protein [Bradymonadia bacterium]